MLHKDTIYGSDSMFFVFVIKEHDFYCLFLFDHASHRDRF